MLPDLTPEQIEAVLAQREAIERKALFTPCTSKAHLKLWIKRYLGIDLPDVIVCDDDVTNPPSNSSPMDLIWEIYEKALDGTDEKAQEFLAYAARDSFKTLSASILEVLCLFHLRRDVAHMAAIEPQAQKAASYVAKYLQRPLLRDFVSGNNKREIRVLRYEDKNGNVLSEDEWDALDQRDQSRYEPVSNYMKIIIATLAGANSEHVSFMVLDELDLAPEGPVEEAKMIPAPGQVRGELPITFMTSTRKFAIGLVQKEIEKAQKDPQNHLQIRHWNLIDVTQRCPPERHLPDEPKQTIYYSESTLRSITEPEWELKTAEEQAKFFKAEGYAGCLTNCSLFAVCRGRLATKQTCTSKMLKPIPHTTTMFKKVSPDRAKAQLMCWKPSSEGLIYPHFNYSRHMLTAYEMAEKITGEKFPKAFNKADLIQLMINRRMEFHSGMDFGYTHNWAVVTGGLDGNRLFVFDVIAIAELELMEKIEVFKSKLSYLNPMVYPDPAYPADIKTFKRHGARCKNFVKDVLGGIEAVRAKVMPGLNKEPEIYFLAGDEGCQLLAERMAQYHWKIDANERPTMVPDDKDDDECDALRYLCQNLFSPKGRVVAALAPTGAGAAMYDPAFPMGQQQVPGMFQGERTVQPGVDNWMQHKIQEATGGVVQEEKRSGRKGSFVFDF
ncbi:terminase large subunit [Myxococcus phage Mx1]|nr:terminase large subunit [Myxococcus phage Mx1]